jgi:hypothetical protein
MTIELNKVTWYSKVLAVILFVLIFYTGFFLGEKKTEVNNLNKVTQVQVDKAKNTETLLKDGKYCYSRLQEATTASPYKVKENVILNIKGDIVTGTKTGTQSGPDMTNGYYGDLKGTVRGNTLELLYSYTVEGSNNKELEVYEMQNNSIVKMRWSLIDKNNVLTPDKIGNPQMILYSEEKCIS